MKHKLFDFKCGPNKSYPAYKYIIESSFRVPVYLDKYESNQL